jgi:outer membrane beta-barrel protein
MTAHRPRARALAAAALAAAALAAMAVPGAARAQSKSDAFAGKIPPVSGQLYRKAGRFELTLGGNLSMNDAFYSKYFGSVKVGYHLTEYLSISGQLATGAAVRAGSATVCNTQTGCSAASGPSLYQVPGHINTMGGLEVAWSPIYGKLNLAAERVAHFDLSLLAGGDWISYEKVVSSNDAAILAAAGQRPPDTGTLGGHVGLGLRVFFAEWLAARLEFKDYIYAVSVPNWQEGGKARSDVQNQLFTELGVSVFFPLQNRPVP